MQDHGSSGNGSFFPWCTTAFAALCVATSLWAAGETAPSAAILLCPWTDMALDTDSMRKFGPTDAVLDTDIMTWFRDCYVKPDQWADPFASPLRGDVSRFPPTLIVVGAIDPLGDDGLRFAKKLEAAGRKVTLQTHAGMPHDFMVFPGIAAGERSLRITRSSARRSPTPRRSPQRISRTHARSSSRRRA